MQLRRRPLLARTLIITSAVSLVAAGCGARLTKAQMAALDANSNNNAVAAGNNPTESNGNSSTPGVTTNLGRSGGGTNNKGHTGNGVAASSGGSGSNGSNTGGSNSGGHSGGGSGPAIVVENNNPLAAPGGKVCAAGAPGSGPGVTASTITIGNIATINGPVPGLFAGARYGTEAVAQYINSLGGLCGRRVVVSSADDQFDQATDQNEASSMARNVLAFVGSFSLQDAGIPAGAPGVPDLGESLSADRFKAATNFSPQPEPPGFGTGPFLYFLHDGSPSDPNSVAHATQHMALLVENTPQTATTGKWESDALKSIGFKFVFTDTNLQPTDPTFNGDVPKMKQAGVQGVVFQATGAIVGQLANAMYSQGIKIVLGNYVASAYDPAYIQNAGPGTQGTLISQNLALYEGEDASAIPMVATFDQWYSRVNPGQVPDLYAAYGWLSGLLLAEGLNAGGAVTRAALTAGLKQITSFTGDGLEPPTNVAGKQPPSCWVLITVQNNKFVRSPATPSGFKCSPSGYFREP